MTTPKRTQLERIVEILECDGQIDNFYAIHNRISLRLGARTWDLRQKGELCAEVGDGMKG